MFRHNHGAAAEVGVVARASVAIGVAVAVAFVVGSVKEQIETSLMTRVASYSISRSYRSAGT